MVKHLVTYGAFYYAYTIFHIYFSNDNGYI